MLPEFIVLEAFPGHFLRGTPRYFSQNQDSPTKNSLTFAVFRVDNQVIFGDYPIETYPIRGLKMPRKQTVSRVPCPCFRRKHATSKPAMRFRLWGPNAGEGVPGQVAVGSLPEEAEWASKKCSQNRQKA